MSFDAVLESLNDMMTNLYNSARLFLMNRLPNYSHEKQFTTKNHQNIKEFLHYCKDCELHVDNWDYTKTYCIKMMVKKMTSLWINDSDRMTSGKEAHLGPHFEHSDSEADAFPYEDWDAIYDLIISSEEEEPYVYRPEPDYVPVDIIGLCKQVNIRHNYRFYSYRIRVYLSFAKIRLLILANFNGESKGK